MNAFDFNEISLGITTPMANECNTAIDFIKEVFEECDKYNFKSISYFVIFDKACNDETYELLRNYTSFESRLKTIYDSDSKSVVDAYITGYRQAIGSSCDWILEIDSGYSHLPKQIHRFFDKMIDNYDCVFGSRFIDGGEYLNSPISRYLISKWGTILVNYLLNTNLKDMTSGFELFNNKSLTQILSNNIIRSNNSFFQTEIREYCHKFNIVEIPITYANPSKKNINKAVFEAINSLFNLYKNKKGVN